MGTADNRDGVEQALETSATATSAASPKRI
jgi:hypothetical protein